MMKLTLRFEQTSYSDIGSPDCVKEVVFSDISEVKASDLLNAFVDFIQYVGYNTDTVDFTMGHDDKFQF